MNKRTNKTERDRVRESVCVSVCLSKQEQTKDTTRVPKTNIPVCNNNNNN